MWLGFEISLKLWVAGLGVEFEGGGESVAGLKVPGAEGLIPLTLKLNLISAKANNYNLLACYSLRSTSSL